MAEEWRDIPGIQGYRASDLGRIMNARTERILHPSYNQHGHPKVNLSIEGRVHTRHVSHLVANSFLDSPQRPDFRSVIHLNGDKKDCASGNLLWRPRYFAIKFHGQFGNLSFQKSKVSIIDIDTGEKYTNIQDAVTRHGLLFADIVISMHERTYVWPTYQQFRAL